MATRQMTEEEITTVVKAAERLEVLLDKAEPFMEQLPAMMQAMAKNPLLRGFFGG